MNVQVITLKSSNMEPGQNERLRGALELAVNDTPGSVTGLWTSIPEAGAIIGVCVWDSARSLEAFRHSELYARFMLCPHLDEARDQELNPGTKPPAGYLVTDEIDLLEWIPEAVYADWQAEKAGAPLQSTAAECPEGDAYEWFPEVVFAQWQHAGVAGYRAQAQPETNHPVPTEGKTIDLLEWIPEAIYAQWVRGQRAVAA